jgi:hypothetical protein
MCGEVVDCIGISVNRVQTAGKRVKFVKSGDISEHNRPVDLD